MASSRGGGGCGDGDSMHMCPDCNKPQMTGPLLGNNNFLVKAGRNAIGALKNAASRDTTTAYKQDVYSEDNVLIGCQKALDSAVDATSEADFNRAQKEIDRLLSKYREYHFNRGYNSTKGKNAYKEQVRKTRIEQARQTANSTGNQHGNSMAEDKDDEWGYDEHEKPDVYTAPPGKSTVPTGPSAPPRGSVGRGQANLRGGGG